MQKAIIVSNGKVGPLNKYLDDGWKFVSACAMPSSSSCDGGGEKIITASCDPTCLVIIEKNK